MPPSETKRAAVIGAGLAGLATAYRLRQSGWQVRLFEAADQVGGRVQTVARDGYLIDTGASAIAESYKAYIELAGELGLSDEIVAAPSSVGIFRDGHLHELNLERPLSAATTPLLSLGAKVRMLRLVWDIALARFRGQLDYDDMGRAAPLDTESAGTYARRALGQEVANYFASPIVRVMLLADPDKISKVELLSGVANIMSTRISALRGGQGRLPQTLARRLEPKLNHPVEQVLETPVGVDLSYRDPEGALHAETFDACVVCCPLPDAYKICRDKRHLLEALGQDLRYTQSITTALAFNDVPRSKSFLVQMPTCEDAEIALLFLDHNKSTDRAPAGKGLIDCHWEWHAAERMMDRSDAEIVERSLQTVCRVFPELQGQFAFSHVTRWRRALPCTSVGIYRLIGDFNAAIDPRSRIQFASDYMSEAGQNSAIELANRAVKRINTRA